MKQNKKKSTTEGDEVLKSYISLFNLVEAQCCPCRIDGTGRDSNLRRGQRRDKLSRKFPFSPMYIR